MRTLHALVFTALASLAAAQSTYTHTLGNIQGSQLSNWVNFSFPGATPTTGGGNISFSWLACWQEVFGGSSKIWIELQTGASTYTQVYYETGNTTECSSLPRTTSVSAQVMENALAFGAGAINGRVKIQDSCYPGVGCSFFNDPLVSGLTLTYETHAANFTAADASVCPGGTVSFSDASLNTPSSYEWHFEGGTPSTSAQQNPTVQYDAPGSWDVTLIVVTADGPDTLQRADFVTVHALPAANAGVDEDLCAGDSEQLQASGGVSYQWFPSTGLSNAAVPNPVASPEETTSYTVLVTDANGCEASDFMVLTVHALPTVAASSGQGYVCLGDTINVVATGALLYSWSPNLFISSVSGASVNVWPTSDFTWTVTGTDQYGCVNTTEAAVDVELPPMAPVVTNTGMGLESSAAEAYQWYLNGTAIDGQTGQVMLPQVNGNYSVVVTNAFGCSSQSLPVYFGTAGLVEMVAMPLRVSPQPAQHTVLIEGLEAGAMMHVIDANGRSLIVERASATRMSLDVSRLAAGRYVIEQVAGDFARRVPLVVE